MKLISLFVLLLAFSCLFTRRVHRYSHRRGPADNIVYQFILGFVAELSGQPAAIDECSQQVKGWESAATEENGDTEKQVGGETSTTFQKVLGYLGKAIDAVCNFKENIIGWLTKSFRRYIRLFIQGKTTRRFRWSLGGMWDSIKSAAVAVGDAVVSGAKTIGNAVVKGVEWVGKKADELFTYVKGQINTLLEPVYNLFEQIKAKFLAWLEKNPLMKKLFEFAKCFLTNSGVKGIKTLFNAVKSVVELIPKLATPAGWIELLVNLVCGWESLKDGINFLLSGIKETNAAKKYNFFGKFAGKIFEAIAG